MNSFPLWRQAYAVYWMGYEFERIEFHWPPRRRAAR